MADYRDDMNDTAWAVDATWAGLRSVAESTVRIGEALLFALLVTGSDAALASDTVQDQPLHIAVEQASAADTVQDSLTARDTIQHTLTMRDTLLGSTCALVDEQATAGEQTLYGLRAVTPEQTQISAQIVSQRSSAGQVTEQARVQDALPWRVSEQVAEQATAGELYWSSAQARTVWADTASVADELPGGQHTSAAVLSDHAHASSTVQDHLLARDLPHEHAAAYDTLPGQPGHGQAWTANVENWATSRYQPFAFAALAAINGQLYAQAADGVYVLEEGAQNLDARLVTGKLDLGQGQLVRPREAYLEYQLEGSAALEVVQTQSGVAPATWRYALPPERATVQTNGRFVLGRGLRGRFFSFILKLTGQRGHVESLGVTTEPTNRRI